MLLAFLSLSLCSILSWLAFVEELSMPEIPGVVSGTLLLESFGHPHFKFEMMVLNSMSAIPGKVSCTLEAYANLLGTTVAGATTSGKTRRKLSLVTGKISCVL